MEAFCISFLLELRKEGNKRGWVKIMGKKTTSHDVVHKLMGLNDVMVLTRALYDC